MKKIIQNIKNYISSEVENFNLSRQEKAFLLMFIVMIFILLSAVIIRLQNSQNEIMLSFEIPNEEFVDIEELLKEKQLTENQLLNATSTAFNESDRNLQHSDEPFKTLEELMQEQAEQNAGNQNNNKDNLSEETSNDDVSEKNQQKAEEIPTEAPIPKKDSPKKDVNYANKNSFIKYELVGRNPRDLPNPIYTCDDSGMVVINIAVNDLGQVIDVSFNASASQTRNNCLIDNALQYAKNALFSKSTQKKQLGTITYYFQPKQ